MIALKKKNPSNPTIISSWIRSGLSLEVAQAFLSIVVKFISLCKSTCTRHSNSPVTSGIIAHEEGR